MLSYSDADSITSTRGTMPSRGYAWLQPKSKVPRGSCVSNPKTHRGSTDVPSNPLIAPSTTERMPPISNTASSTKAKAPFNEPTADVIFRTSDNVDFYSHKIILSFSSLFFKDMFTLEQSPIPHESSDAAQLPVVNISESSETWDTLLRLCYPIPDPPLPTLAIIDSILAAASKYEMDHPLQVLSKTLRRLRKTQPLQVYAVACRWRLEGVASEAARVVRETLRSSRSTPGPHTRWNQSLAGECFVSEMADIPAGAYFRLLSFLRSGNVPIFCHPPPTNDPISTSQTLRPLDLPWLLNADCDANIILTSLGNWEFPVHSAIISNASPVLKDIVNTHTPPSGSITGGFPTVDLPENCLVTSILVSLCYPMRCIELEDVDFGIARVVIDTTMKYDIVGGAMFCRRMLQKHTYTSPFPVFCTAIRYRWDAEARLAAIELARRSTVDVYTPELEEINTLYYHALLKFQHEYKEAVCNLTDPSKAYQNWDHARALFEAKGKSEPPAISPETVFASIIATVKGDVTGGVNKRIQHYERLEDFLGTSLAGVSRISLAADLRR